MSIVNSTNNGIKYKKSTAHEKELIRDEFQATNTIKSIATTVIILWYLFDFIFN